MRSSNDAAPRDDEVEVSLFGPGVGECVVLHLGGGEWLVIDSCIDPETRRPVALDYLDRIDVDHSLIRLVALTHWHNDHTRGAAELIAAAPEARVVCSAALNQKEFQLAVGAANTQERSGLEELTRVFQALLSRRGSLPATSTGPEWALANQVLYRSGLGSIHALSPSPSTFTRTLHEISELLPAIGRTKRRAVASRPNELSLVIWVATPSGCVLLGGDLERGRDPQSGWLANANSMTRPTGTAQTFKVPHHGSEGADEAAVWDGTLDAEPRALLSTFTPSGLPLPTDLVRISGHTPFVYCTGPSRGPKPMRRSGAVEKIVRRVAPELRRTSGQMGHIRLRFSASSDPVVQLSGPAYQFR